MRYLLDTNIVSDLVRRPQGRIAERIRKVGEPRFTSITASASGFEGSALSSAVYANSSGGPSIASLGDG